MYMHIHNHDPEYTHRQELDALIGQGLIHTVRIGGRSGHGTTTSSQDTHNQRDIMLLFET